MIQQSSEVSQLMTSMINFADNRDVQIFSRENMKAFQRKDGIVKETESIREKR